MKNRPLTCVGAFFVLLIALAVWNNLKKPEISIQTKSQPTADSSEVVRKTKSRKPESSGKQEPSFEVQSRLADLGFKSNSFIAVKTKKHETEK